MRLVRVACFKAVQAKFIDLTLPSNTTTTTTNIILVTIIINNNYHDHNNNMAVKLATGDRISVVIRSV